MWVVPTHFFLKTYVIAILSQGWCCFLRGRLWTLLICCLFIQKGSHPTTTRFNHSLPNSMDPGTIYIGYVFWVSPSGPRKSLHTLLPFSHLSLPNIPRSLLSYHNSTLIFSQMSNGKHLQVQDKCRSGAVSPAETLVSDSQGKFICKEGSF